MMAYVGVLQFIYTMGCARMECVQMILLAQMNTQVNVILLLNKNECQLHVTSK